MTDIPQIEYTVQVWQEGRDFIAHAMPLDVMSAGKTPETARQALDEAVQLFLSAAEENGTLTEVLEETGYESCDDAWRSPPWIGVERHVVPARG